MSARRRIAVVLALVASSAMFAGPAHADARDAERLFEEGTKLLEDKRFADACPKLEESRRMATGIGITMYLADCYEGLGHLTKASELFVEAAELARAKRDKREPLARQRAAEVSAKVPKLVISVAAPPDDLALFVDGVPLDRARLGQEIAVDVGPRVVRAESRTGRWEESFVASPGRVIEIRVPALTKIGEPAIGSPATSPKRALTPWQTAGIVQLAVGGVAVGVGLVFGSRAIGKQSESNDGPCENDRCDARGLALRDEALSAATVSTVFVAAGAVVMASGAGFLLFGPKAKDKASAVFRPHVGGASVIGRF